jgi:hypothetical protein
MDSDDDALPARLRGPPKSAAAKTPKTPRTRSTAGAKDIRRKANAGRSNNNSAGDADALSPSPSAAADPLKAQMDEDILDMKAELREVTIAALTLLIFAHLRGCLFFPNPALWDLTAWVPGAERKDSCYRRNGAMSLGLLLKCDAGHVLTTSRAGYQAKILEEVGSYSKLMKAREKDQAQWQKVASPPISIPEPSPPHRLHCIL